jgi:hypothetical protein
MRILMLVAIVASVAGCNDKAARSSDDILICKLFYTEASNRMGDLNRETFQPDDLTFDQLNLLTPRDPDWRDAEFLVLRSEWGRTSDPKRIVIVCGKSRVRDGVRVHAVGYSTGEAAWVLEPEIAKLQLRDFLVLPKIKP